MWTQHALREEQCLTLSAGHQCLWNGVCGPGASPSSATQHAVALTLSKSIHPFRCSDHVCRGTCSALTMFPRRSGILAERHCRTPLRLGSRLLAGRTPVVQHPVHPRYIHRCAAVLLLVQATLNLCLAELLTRAVDSTAAVAVPGGEARCCAVQGWQALRWICRSPPVSPMLV